MTSIFMSKLEVLHLLSSRYEARSRFLIVAVVAVRLKVVLLRTLIVVVVASYLFRFRWRGR